MSFVQRAAALVAADEMAAYPLGDIRLEGHFFVAWHHSRWLNSTMHLMATYEVQGLARALFAIAQVQCPTGTLPTDDVQLARLLRFDVTRFKELRAMEFGPLRGWVPCLCGTEVRLMHPVVVSVLEDAMARREAREAANTEKAVAQRIKRLREALSGLGLSASVLQDQRLIERMDGWLLENNPGQRRAASYEAVVTHAGREGWYGEGRRRD